MLNTETPSLHKTKKIKSEPKQTPIRADLKPGIVCPIYLFLVPTTVFFLRIWVKICTNCFIFLIRYDMKCLKFEL